MPELHLAESPDGIVNRTWIIDNNTVGYQIEVPFQHSEQIEQFLAAKENGHVYADLRMRRSFLGIDLSTIGEGNDAFELVGDSVIFEAKGFPYRSNCQPSDASWTDVLDHTKLTVGKLISLTKNDYLTPDEVMEAIKDGKIDLFKGSYISDNGVHIALDGHTYHPVPETYNRSRLFEALGKMKRMDLAKYQKPSEEASEYVTIPKDDGILAHSTIRTVHPLVLRHDQAAGVSTTQAMHVRPNSGMDLFVGLKGNGERDVNLESVVADFIDNSTFEPTTTVSVPDRELRGYVHEPEFGSSAESVFIYVPTSTQGMIREIGSFDSKDLAQMIELERDLRGLRGDNHTLYFQEFPSRTVVNQITGAEVLSKISNVIFLDAPVHNTGFSDTDYADILNLKANGVNVVWDHHDHDRLHFHRVGFMRDGEQTYFDRARESSSAFTMFGSARGVSQDDEKNIHQVMRALKKFAGECVYIFNGGGPGIMSATTDAAHKYGFHTGLISLNIAQEQQTHDKIYTIMPFADQQINIRQKILVDSATGGTYTFGGGTGSVYEIQEAATKNSIGGMTIPHSIVGVGAMQHKVIGLMETLVRTKKASPSILESVQHMLSGARAYDHLMNHYGFDSNVPYRRSE